MRGGGEMCQGSISPKAIHSDHADCHDDNFYDDDFDDEEKGLRGSSS